MIDFKYIISDELGIHARPAGIIIREIKKYESKVCVMHGEKSTDGTGVFGLMKLGAKKGSELVLNIEGIDEAEAAEGIKRVLTETKL
jgi:phosphocarrier protein